MDDKNINNNNSGNNNGGNNFNNNNFNSNTNTNLNKYNNYNNNNNNSINNSNNYNNNNNYSGVNNSQPQTFVYNNGYKTPKIPKQNQRPSKYQPLKTQTQFSKPDIAKNIGELVDYLNTRKQIIEGKSPVVTSPVLNSSSTSTPSISTSSTPTLTNTTTTTTTTTSSSFSSPSSSSYNNHNNLSLICSESEDLDSDSNSNSNDNNNFTSCSSSSTSLLPKINNNIPGEGVVNLNGEFEDLKTIEEYSNIFKKLKQENSFNDIINFSEKEILVFCDVCKHYFSDFKKNKFNNFDKLLLYLAFSKAGSSTTHISKMFNVTQVTISRVVQKIRLIIDQLSKNDLPFDIFRPTVHPIHNTYHIGLVVDCITIKTTIADSKKKEYFDPINNIYGIKFMVAVLFTEPHYAIFVSPPYLGSTTDLSIFNEQKQNLKNYLRKQQTTREMDKSGKYQSWAILTLFDEKSTGNAFPCSDYYSMIDGKISIIQDKSNIMVTDSSGSNGVGNGEDGDDMDPSQIRVISVNRNLEQLLPHRMHIDKYFGRLYGLWGITGNYRLDQRYIEIDFKNLLWLTNIHIQKKDLDQDDLHFFYQFKKTLYGSDKRIVRSKRIGPMTDIEKLEKQYIKTHTLPRKSHSTSSSSPFATISQPLSPSSQQPLSPPQPNQRFQIKNNIVTSLSSNPNSTSPIILFSKPTNNNGNGDFNEESEYEESEDDGLFIDDTTITTPPNNNNNNVGISSSINNNSNNNNNNNKKNNDEDIDDDNNSLIQDNLDFEDSDESYSGHSDYDDDDDLQLLQKLQQHKKNKKQNQQNQHHSSADNPLKKRKILNK